MDYYDIDKIITYASTGNVDISPEDREEWVMFCCALKVLGYDLNTFISMSNCDETECRKVWNKEKNPSRYVTTKEKAKAKIFGLAKAAGVDLERFKLETAPNDATAPTAPKYTKVYQVYQVYQNVSDFDGVELPEYTPVFVEEEEIEKTEKTREETALYNFLCRLFPSEEVSRVFRRYRVGGTDEFRTSPPNLASAFPYINAEGACVDIHFMPFDNNGHRWKSGYSQNWLLAMKKQGDLRAPWSLFGEHLLQSDTSTPVGVVESEKTALVAAICAPGYIWTATGSISNLNARRCAAIKSRDCYIFPDVDGVERWREKAEELRKEGFKVFFCSDYIAQYAQEPKDDLADIICRYRASLQEL